jgi:plastocyanin
MRSTRVGLFALMAAALLGAGCGDDSTDPIDDEDPLTAIVSMPGFSFAPFNTTIKVGGTVTFEFPAEQHNVIFERITGAPADIQPTRNQRVNRAFPVAGTFDFDCTLHPGMSGSVLAR